MQEMNPGPGGGSAGARLRQAREAAGLDLETLAANVRVSAAKLALLESDRHAELPDPAFARALALTVCRALHIDPAPVLAGLPQAQQGPRLEQVNQGLNQPFGPRRAWLGLARLEGPRLQAPAAVAAAVLVLGALGVYFWPSIQRLGDAVAPSAAPAPSAPASLASSSMSPPASLPGGGQGGQASAKGEAATRDGAMAPSMAAPAALAGEGAPASARDASGADARAAGPAAQPASAAPMLQAASQLGLPSATPAAASAAAALSAAPLLLRATAPSWVEVRDAAGRSMLSRQLAAGETAALAGAAPWRIRIGNAGATELMLRGQRIDLAPHTRNNVARLELK